MTDIPVKGDVLKWAREFRGLNEQQAAELLSIPVEELRAYEANRQPTLTMFETFAAKYRLPQATLFRATRPKKIPGPPQDFRTHKGKAAKTSLAFNIALSNVRTLNRAIHRIAEDDEEFDAPYLPRITLDQNPEEAGERERRRIGPPFQEQFSWKAAEAYRRWRARLEKEGISVIQQKFPIDDCRGFSLFEDEFAPTIVVNREEEYDTARTFTLAHEYCHLLLRRPGISDHDPRDPVEAFCNRFAAAFLIPQGALRALLPVWPNEPREWTREQIAKWAKRLKVSQIALAIRLEGLEIAPKGFSDQFEFTGPKKEKKKSKGGDGVKNRMSEIGGNVMVRAISAYDRNVIDEVQTAETLGLAPKHFEAVRASIARRQELAGNS